MSLIYAVDGWTQADLNVYASCNKFASDVATAYNLVGRLYVSGDGDNVWGLLSVPNAMQRGVFDAMHEPGCQLPFQNDGTLNAHISVFRPEEIKLIGGADKLLPDRGKQFTYSLGRLVEIEPTDWSGISRCWAIIVHSPQLQLLRRSYGLTSLPNDGKFAFHITVAVRRKGILGRNEISKSQLSAAT